MRALTHLFGSVDGYRTMARAPGVTDAEDAALAALGFGSPRDEAEIDQLAGSPCIAARLLPSGRYAITRLFPGARDVAGRSTIERRTLVLETADWSTIAAGDVAATLADDRNWTRAAFAGGQPIELHGHASRDLLPQPTETERRVFDALLTAHEAGRCAALPCSSRWNDAVLRLPSLLPSSQAMLLGWGVGLWAVPAGVWVATMRVTTPTRGAFTATTSGGWKHPEQVQRLGQDSSPRFDASYQELPTRSAPWKRFLPWIIGVSVALLALLLLSIVLLTSGSGRAQGKGAEAPTADGAAATPQPPAPSVPPPVPAPMPPVQAPVKDAAGPADRSGAGLSASTPTKQDAGPAMPSNAPASAPSAGGASNGTAPAGSRAPAPSAPKEPGPAFQSVAAEDGVSAFGNGPGSEQSSAPAPQKPADKPADPSPDPAANPSKGGATPETKPNIPSAVDTTPWSSETRLLKLAIDLHERAIKTTSADVANALLVDLEAHNALLDVRKRENEKPAEDGLPPANQKCLVDFDARGKNPAGLNTVVEAQLATPNSAPPQRRLLLLCAKFEIALAVQELVRKGMIQTDALKDSLVSEVRADGWPGSASWSGWFWRAKPSPYDPNPSRAAAVLAGWFLKAVKGTPNNTEASEQLRRITEVRATATTPAPGTGATP